jgi:hypothetical protein
VTGQHSNQLNYQPIGPKKQAYAIFRIAKIGILIFYKQNFIKIYYIIKDIFQIKKYHATAKK